jgi:hypothetical protein
MGSYYSTPYSGGYPAALGNWLEVLHFSRVVNIARIVCRCLMHYPLKDPNASDWWNNLLLLAIFLDQPDSLKLLLDDYPATDGVPWQWHHGISDKIELLASMGSSLVGVDMPTFVHYLHSLPIVLEQPKIYWILLTDLGNRHRHTQLQFVLLENLEVAITRKQSHIAYMISDFLCNLPRDTLTGMIKSSSRLVILAIKLGWEDVVVDLLRIGVDPNSTDLMRCTLLTHAIDIGSLKIFLELLDRGVDVYKGRGLDMEPEKVLRSRLRLFNDEQPFNTGVLTQDEDPKVFNVHEEEYKKVPAWLKMQSALELRFAEDDLRGAGLRQTEVKEDQLRKSESRKTDWE